MRSVLLILAAALLAPACQTVVDVELPEHPPRLVVNGFFAPDSVWSVTVTRSADVQAPVDEPAPVMDAVVQVMPEDGEAEVLGHVGGGVYRSVRGSRPEPGRAYALRVEAEGFPVATATASVPPPVDVEEVGVSCEEPPPAVPARACTLTFQFVDPAGPQHYRLQTRQRAPLVVDERGRLAVSDVAESEPGLWYLFFGSTDAALVEAYDDLDQSDRLPTIDGEYRPLGKAILSDQTFEGEERRVELFIQPGFFTHAEPYHELRFSVLSDAFVRYHRTLEDQNNKLDNPYAESVQVYSNVEGGLGIFAGYATTVVPLDVPSPQN